MGWVAPPLFKGGGEVPRSETQTQHQCEAFGAAAKRTLRKIKRRRNLIYFSQLRKPYYASIGTICQLILFESMIK